MKLATKVLFFCGALLVQVYGSSLESRDVEETNQDDENVDNRGLLDVILGRPILSNTNSHERPFVVPPPLMPETVPFAPSIPVPPVSNPTNHVHRPGLLNQLGNHIDNLLGRSSEETPLGLNLDWVRNALSKCAKLDPRQFTAILPTATNQLREPRMYYFENSTSNTKTWAEAQQWCSKNGMQLATINDINENKVLQNKIVQILAGSTPGGIDSPNAYWVGLNKLVTAGAWTWVGDSSSTFTDWHPVIDTIAAEPSTAATDLCVAISQRVTAENIHLDAKDCSAIKFRFICEVSEPCVSLLMSRYRTQYHVPHHHHHHHQINNPLNNILGSREFILGK